MADAVLITDFDGTITGREFYDLVLERSGGGEDWAEYLAGRITHFEVMRRILARAPTAPDQLEELLEAMEPDPELAAGVARLRRAGWEVVVVSAGSTWYIDRILARAGIQGLEVHANPGHIEPGCGLVLELPGGSPFFSPDVGIDKSAVLRDARARFRRVAFAGDGPPDLPPALLTAPEDRFARRWLAGEMERRKAVFRRFERWSEIPRALAC